MVKHNILIRNLSKRRKAYFRKNKKTLKRISKRKNKKYTSKYRSKIRKDIKKYKRIIKSKRNPRRRQKGGLEPQDVTVGMTVALVQDPDQKGTVMKREGDKVRIDFGEKKLWRTVNELQLAAQETLTEQEIADRVASVVLPRGQKNARQEQLHAHREATRVRKSGTAAEPEPGDPGKAWAEAAAIDMATRIRRKRVEKEVEGIHASRKRRRSKSSTASSTSTKGKSSGAFLRAERSRKKLEKRIQESPEEFLHI